MKKESGQTIIAFTHGEKDSQSVPGGNERLTPYGAMQVFAAVLEIYGGWVPLPDRIIHSGVSRARQSAEIIKAALLSDALLDVNAALDVRAMFQEFDHRETLREIHAARAESDTVLHVTKITRYGHAACQRATETILGIARQMEERQESLVIVVSHSPYIEMAATGDPGNGRNCAEYVPCGLGEADAVTYVVDDGRIIRTHYSRGPLPGRRI